MMVSYGIHVPITIKYVGHFYDIDDEKNWLCFTYRRIDVKYWSRKSLACSSTTSGLRASVVINGKFAPCTMLPMQMVREHANALLGVC